MPNIAQQDYIVIDWEGKSGSDEGKIAEVRAMLKKIYKANPRAILSVVIDHYDDSIYTNERILSVEENTEEGKVGELSHVYFYSGSSQEIVRV